MTYLNDFKIAFRAISRNKARTSLTVTGLVIGVASIFIVFSAGSGLEGLILGQVSSFGTNIIETEVKIPTGKIKNSAEDTSQSSTAIIQGVQITTLTPKDMEDIDKIPNVIDSYGALMSQGIVSYNSEKETATFYGISPSFIDIDLSEVQKGRFFTDSENESLARVVILGSKIKNTLFGESQAIGKFINMKNSKYKVIGVMEKRGTVMAMDFDNYVYLPVKTLQKRIIGGDYFMYMIHQIKNLNIAEQTAEQITYILRNNHGIIDPLKDDFRVTTMGEMMSMLNTITGAITLLLLAIVIISLVVAGVGITNVMYVIISERTTEIGLRKAVGANYNDIIRQFLIESILITFIGFIFGFIFGALLSFGVAIVAQSKGLDWTFAIPLKSIITAFIFSLFAGVVFGYFPARKAALMEPVTALRKE